MARNGSSTHDKKSEKSDNWFTSKDFYFILVAKDRLENPKRSILFFGNEEGKLKAAIGKNQS
ncbi:hypothetical protein [uncultured Planococcus sp.]|uniref:hypothetical protein n=1 Tax=uncultured Planococcus sp. TaxID=337815 RepID=UPI00261536C4|nr:hypothetical protein [uncultured Planococcus sp.]